MLLARSISIFLLGVVSLGMDFGPRLGQQLRHVNGPRREHELKDRLKDWIDERNESPHFYLSVSQEMKYVLYNIVGISVPRNGLVITLNCTGKDICE